MLYLGKMFQKHFMCFLIMFNVAEKAIESNATSSFKVKLIYFIILIGVHRNKNSRSDDS